MTGRHPVCKTLGVGLLVVTFDWIFARLIAPLSPPLTSSIASLKMAKPGSPGEMVIKTERERERERESHYTFW